MPYLDDLLLIARTKEDCEKILKTTLAILTELGWIISMKKSRITPQQTFVWLGVEYDLVNHTVNNSEQNIVQFHQKLQELAWHNNSIAKATTKHNKKIFKTPQKVSPGYSAEHRAYPKQNGDS